MRNRLKRCLVFPLLLSVLFLTSCGILPFNGGSPPSADTSAAPSYEVIAGYAIKTDYTGLTDYKPAAEKYTRIADGPLDSLQPSDKYGPLLPYVGETLYNAGGYAESNLYGLVTKDAQIVTDPIYTSAWQGYYYAFGSNSGTYMPAYQLEKLADTIDEDNLWDNIRHAVCALDGSWVTPFDYKEVYFLDTVIILVRDYATNDVDVMDYDGSLLYNSKSLDCYSELPPDSAYMFQSCYGEGLSALTLVSGKTVYLDVETGEEHVIAYEQGGAFSGGLAAVKKDGLYGYIDRRYNLVIPVSFMSAEYFYNGRGSVQYTDGSYALIDKSGAVLMTSTGYIGRWDDGIYGIYDGTNTTRYYDADLKEIKQGDYPVEPLSDGWFYYKTDTGVVLFRGSDSIELPGVSGVGYVRGGLLSYYVDGPNWQEGLMTLEGKVLIPAAEYQSITLSVSEVSDKTYAIVSTYDQYGSSSIFKIYDGDGKFLFSGSGWANLVTQHDLFEVHNESSYAIIDLTGNDLFRISLLDNVPD